MNNKKIWYEIHVTASVTPSEKERFVNICQNLNVKPIVLDLESYPNEVVIQDVMTSSKHYGTDESAFLEMMRIAQGLNAESFTVLRRKIESEPNHVNAPQQQGELMLENTYFESHIAFEINEADRSKLAILAHGCSAHISRNPFKKTKLGMVVMVTLRDYKSPFCVFKQSIDNLLNRAADQGFVPCKKIEIEFAVYDSNTMHDSAWLNCVSPSS